MMMMMIIGGFIFFRDKYCKVSSNSTLTCIERTTGRQIGVVKKNENGRTSAAVTIIAIVMISLV